MKFGILFRPQSPPDGRGLVQRWQEILHAAEVAEDSGFDGVFVPEHHMMDDGYLPSPITGVAALAARTKTVDVGTTIHQLPLSHPVHTAEAAATVDVLSNGRMRLGVGLGGFRPELELFGIAPDTITSRFEESIEIVRKCWSGRYFQHKGRHFNLSAQITPTPISPELWIGAQSDGGARRAGRMGAPWITDPLHNINVIKRWAELYRSSAEGQSKPRVHLLRNAWLGRTVDEVGQFWWPHVRSDHWFYFRQVPRWVRELEPTLENVESENDFYFHEHHRDRLIVGDPDSCIASIKQFEQELDPEYMILTLRFATGPSHEAEVRCIRDFGRHVLANV